MKLWTIALCLLVATTAAAYPHRDGANHHLGDDSFVAFHGRLPNDGDSERVRMHDHLVYVRGLLGARPATARRTELLGYLDDYIAAGITPRNTYVPWRNPVFIDADGRICAVGYLIERSAGRALAETIARTHRLDYLEDIAAAMPEVRAWIAASGFTLDELASIQPGYRPPTYEQAFPLTVADGPFKAEREVDAEYPARPDDVITRGHFKKHRMTGSWTVTRRDGKRVGWGEFANGTGEWTSIRPDGTRLARGMYVDNRAHGDWVIYHPSGRVAAEGRYERGFRSGAWRFYYDDAAHTPIATGRFKKGLLVGTWRHYDPKGNVIASAYSAGESLSLTATPDANGVTYEYAGGRPATLERVDAYHTAREHIYIYTTNRDDKGVRDETIYDGEGNVLVRSATGWTAASCGWTAKDKRSARSGGATFMLYRLRGGSEGCDEPAPVSAARAKAIDAALAAHTRVRMAIPAFVKARPVIEGESVRYYDAKDRDFVRQLTAFMGWYMEWQDVDGAFDMARDTMPGGSTSEY